MAERSNWLKPKKRHRKTSSQRRISGSAYSWRRSAGKPGAASGPGPLPFGRVGRRERDAEAHGTAHAFALRAAAQDGARRQRRANAAMVLLDGQHDLGRPEQEVAHLRRHGNLREFGGAYQGFVDESFPRLREY